eukprot:s3146_g5.t1
MRDEEETTVFRQRTGRLAKWRDLAQEAAREKSTTTVLPEGLQNLVLSGDIIIALLPGGKGARKTVVGVVMSVWVSLRKPRLATSSAPMNHCVAARMVVMDGVGMEFKCNARSPAWVIQPESIVSILAWDSFQDAPEECKVKLTQESVDMLEQI